MTLAYTNFHHITVIFTVASLAGLVAALWSLRESWLDRQALNGGAYGAERRNVNNSAIQNELLRIAVHVIFVSIGMIGMFWDPATRGRIVNEAVGYTFGFAPALLAVASLLTLYMRRQLTALISERREP